MEPARGFTPPRSLLIELRQHSGIVGIVNSLLCEFAIEREVEFLRRARGALVHASVPVSHLVQFFLRLGTDSLQARGGSRMWGGLANAMEP